MENSSPAKEREKRYARERKRIGAMIRGARKNTRIGKGRMTQSDLAMFVGTSKERISRVENGHTSLHAHELVLACEKLGLTVVFAVDLEKHKTS